MSLVRSRLSPAIEARFILDHTRTQSAERAVQDLVDGALAMAVVTLAQQSVPALSSQMEAWKAIPGYEGRYEASCQGRIRSLVHNKNQCRNVLRKTPLILKQQRKKDIYEYYYVHNLVLAAFVGPRPEGHEGCHRNGKSWDNRLENLRWATPKENSADKAKHGTVLKGSQLKVAKLNEEKVREIRRLYESGVGPTALAKKFGVYIRTIFFVVRREKWKHVT
jgi:hypothetical protein